MKIHISSGVGSGPTTLAAFDSALNATGIANYNLLRLSSVVPPNTDISQHIDRAIPKELLPGEWGDRLYVVMAEQRTDTPNEEAWAGIGWVQDPETKKGLFVEHEGNNERQVRRDITQSLEALMATRNVDFGPINMQVVGRTCTHHPVCAMVVAVYQASDWNNKAELINKMTAEASVPFENVDIISKDMVDNDTDGSLQQADITAPPVECDVDKLNRLRRVMRAAKLSVEAAVVAIELSPANEAIRFGAFGATQAASASPVVSGLVLGGATLAVEGVAALATADLLNTDRGKRTAENINTKLDRIIPGGVKMSAPVEAAVAYLGGTSVVVAEKHREDPSRTLEENRKHGLFTAGWLSGVLTIQGTLLANGISSPEPKTIGMAVAGVVGVPALAQWAKKRFSIQPEADVERTQWVDVDEANNTTYQLTSDLELLDKAALLESEVWKEEGFGSLNEYEQHIAKSRTYTAYQGNECVGVARIFRASEVGVPPFASSMPFDSASEQQAVYNDCVSGITEEMGTIAVAPNLRDGIVFSRLARLSYRDARDRGIKSWGIIMEPERVHKWNEQYGFTFKQLGSTIDYQGGMCAAHIMDLEEVDQNMSKKFPEIYDWFVNQPLNT